MPDQQSDMRVPVLGFLANNLRGYERRSILREQLQNADDAGFKQGRSGELVVRFLEDSLVITNPSLFTDEDWRRLQEPNSRGKLDDPDQIGEFGVGFWGCLHLTDSPVVASGTIQRRFTPPRIDTEEIPHLDGTRIDFAYRRTPTELAEALEAKPVTREAEAEIAESFVGQMAELLLFTRAITAMTIEMPGGELRRAIRVIEPIQSGVERLTITIDGAPDRTGSYLVVRTRIPDPPKGRHGRVAVALPLTAPHRGPGRAFFTFPTETPSGLHLSVDGHFRADATRKSLESHGEHGSWNDRIFAVAGHAVGEALETVLDITVNGQGFEDAVSWFAETGSPLPDVGRRVRRFLEALDSEARERRVIPDRTGRLRHHSELVRLPAEVEILLGDAVGETVMPLRLPTTLGVLTRWGLRTWGPSAVAGWIRENVPHQRTERATAPTFLRDEDDALTLLDFCAGQEQLLQGVALLLGTDDAYHPVGGPLARPSDDMLHLVDGLARPLVARSFQRSLGARFAPRTDPRWLREAVIESTDLLVGKKVPQPKIGVANKQQHVSEAIELVRKAGKGFEGVPLALDENGVLQTFCDITVIGLPDGPARKGAERLARRLGLEPVHRSIDSEMLEGAGERFGVSLIAELIVGVDDWDPVEDSRLLVEVLGPLAHGIEVSPVLIEQIRMMKIWQGSDGQVHALHDLRLPSREGISKSSRPLIAPELVGPPEPSAPTFATFQNLLRVEILNMTEEIVLLCETPPRTVEDLRDLLHQLADCDRLSKWQTERLWRAPFVLCRDGKARTPAEVLLTKDRLPLDLNNRCVDDEAGRDRRVRQRLQELGSPELPSPADLLAVATDIARRPVSSDLATDPGRILWDHLAGAHERYTRGALGELASHAWLTTMPGPARRRPQDCYDPALSFASFLLPVPYGVATPPQALRDGLRIKSRLETADLITIATKAAEEGSPLAAEFFRYTNRRCDDGAEERRLGALRSQAIIPLTTGLTRPDRLVSRGRGPIWGHLRDLVPDNFVTDYPNLLRAWGVTSEGAVPWQEHLDVLAELAELPRLGAADRALAADRVCSLADLALDDHRIETVRQRGHILTSLGLKPCSVALRGDLPPATQKRLARLLPVAEESDVIVELLDRLQLVSLRSAIVLDPLVEGERSDERWPPVLRIQATNILRFLKFSGTHLDQTLLDTWPPIVRSVSTLTVRAAIDGEIIDEWPADAHLAQQGEEAILYVQAGRLDERAVTDAIASVFALKQGTKLLLRAVLTASTAQEGSELLDDDRIPQLTEREAAYIYEQTATEIRFVEPEIVQPVWDGEVSSGDRAPATEAIGDPDDAGAPDVEDVDDVAPSPRDDTDAIEVDRDRLADDLAALVSELMTPSFESDTPDRGLLQSSRGATDFAALEDEGIVIVRDLDEAPEDEDYQPAPTGEDEALRDEVRICLSFFDVSQGLLPVSARAVAWLSSGVELREVILFGERVLARVVGPKHVALEDGTSIFHARQVVPGTVMRLHPSVPGVVEVEVRADVHRVNGVWMLEFGDDGRLNRLRQDDLELEWETDDAFYRAERRLEDIEALMADGGKSAVQLIIEVFLARPGEGLTADEIWGLVAISRLFAKSTISQTLASQPGLFEYRDGRWYKTGDELRMPRSTGTSTASRTRAPAAPANRPPELIRLARKLAALLAAADAETLDQVIDLLGLRSLLADRAFARACEEFLRDGNATLLAGITRDIERDPGLGAVAVGALEGADAGKLAAGRPILELLTAKGAAAAVMGARRLLARLDAIAGAASSDPVEDVEHLLTAHAQGDIGDGTLWDGVQRMWSDRPKGDPLVEPSIWVASIASRERLHRRAVQAAAAPQRPIDARNGELGWANAQLPADVYDEPDLQRLRAVLDLVTGAPAEVVLDGLHQLAKLAEQAPGGDGDAAMLYSLLGAHARSARVQNKVTARSDKRLRDLRGSAAGPETERFVDIWASLAHLPKTEILRQRST